jgi:hypothetical protein
VILRLTVPAAPTIAAGGAVDMPVAASLDADRWANDGGTFAAPDRAVAAARSGGRR